MYHCVCVCVSRCFPRPQLFFYFLFFFHPIFKGEQKYTREKRHIPSCGAGPTPVVFIVKKRISFISWAKGGACLIPPRVLRLLPQMRMEFVRPTFSMIHRRCRLVVVVKGRKFPFYQDILLKRRKNYKRRRGENAISWTALDMRSPYPKWKSVVCTRKKKTIGNRLNFSSSSSGTPFFCCFLTTTSLLAIVQNYRRTRRYRIHDDTCLVES